MLRINQTSNSSGAAKYFEEGLQRGDYYASKELSVGQWGGKVATRLGLAGEVKKEDFVALCSNQKPEDNSKLNPRSSPQRKVGYDFTFSVPKSVSVAYVVTKDERIRKAFEESVEETMREIERTEMRTQIGQGKDKQHIRTGEMVWASFTHRTSRPVDGIPDPHLHRHCFAFQTTWNEGKERFQAGEFGRIKQTAPYFEAAFDSRLALKMQKLGYAVERRGLSWEIAGMNKGVLKTFSRRTSLIEKVAAQQQRKHGTITPEQKAQIGTLTREKKLVGQSYDQLRQGWLSRLSDSESDNILDTRKRGLAIEEKNAALATEAVNKAQRHLLERKSVVRAYQLKAEALKRSYGEASPEEIRKAVQQGIKQKQLYEKSDDKHHYITSREAVAEEFNLLRHVREGRGKQLPLHSDYQPQASFLNDQQRAAIRHTLTDRNNVTIISGGAGTGKTTLLKEIRNAVEGKGKMMIGLAPSSAATEVLRSEGFAKAETVARMLVDKKLQQQVQNGVILVDEAGLLGNKDMNHLFAIARKQQARILLSGDTRQHASVARGDALRTLEHEGGINVARVHEIQRQKHQHHYKMAVSMAAKGETDAALLKLDQMGDVVEIAEGRHRLTMLVTDYADAIKQKKTALIVSPTHAEGQKVSDALRQKLKVDGLIGEQDRHFKQLKNLNWTEENKQDAALYRAQEQPLTIAFHQNAPGHRKGEQWQVVQQAPLDRQSVLARKADGTEQAIDLQHANRFTVYAQDHLPLAKGDRLRIAQGGKTLEGTRLNNGDIFTVKGFTKQGDIRLHTGKTLSKDYANLSQGFVTTSHSAQGSTVQEVFIAQSSQSIPATTQQQFYVSISRAKERCRIYTDDKKSLEQAVKRDGQRMSAREVAEREHRSKIIHQQVRNKTASKASKQQQYGRGKSL